VAKSSGGEEGSDDGPMGGGSEASRRPEEDPSDQSAGQSANPPLAVGTRVEARYLLSSGRMTSRFYPGRVAGQNEDGTYQVEYDDGDKWYNVPQEVIVVTSGAAPATPGSQAAEVAKNTHRQSLRSVTLELAPLCGRPGLGPSGLRTLGGWSVTGAAVASSKDTGSESGQSSNHLG